jgi:hypothetical protein
LNEYPSLSKVKKTQLLLKNNRYLSEISTNLDSVKSSGKPNHLGFHMNKAVNRTSQKMATLGRFLEVISSQKRHFQPPLPPTLRFLCFGGTVNQSACEI